VKVEKLLGVPAQKNIFNSIAHLMNLVKSLEKRRKIEKMQTQFSYTAGEEYYNLC
jgi:hypothetical protein